MADDIKRIQDIIDKAAKWGERKGAHNTRRHITSGAFWITPNGGVRVINSGKYHITDVIQNPEVFGLSRNTIDSAYDEHGERMGQEGVARDNLMTNLLKDGWIRVRVRRNSYSIQVWQFNPKTNTAIENFISSLIEDGVDGEFANEHDEAKINSLKTSKMKTVTFGDILKGRLYETVERNADILQYPR